MALEIKSPGALLDQIKRDVERSTMRARNGIKLVTGAEEPDLGASPKDVVWSEDRSQLWRYRSPNRGSGPPVLIIYSLLNRSYILDLHQGNSFVERLLDAGFDVYLLDWGVADERDADNTLEDYVLHYMGQAVDVVLERSGTEKLNLVGYCLGGVFALLHTAATKSEKIQSLAVIATPIDLHNQGLYSDMFLRDRFEVEEIIDETGNVPASALRRMSSMMKPTSGVMNYVNLLDRLWNDDFLFAWRAMTRWAGDHIPFPGAAARQMVPMMVRQNAMLHDQMVIDGEPISFRDITCPFLTIWASKDHIVPPKSTGVLIDLVGSADKQELEVEAGHVGIFVGRIGATKTTPSIIEFIREKSAPATSKKKAGRRTAASSTGRKAAR